MPLSEKRKASNRRWDEKNLKRLSLAIPIELFNELDAHLRETGMTRNRFITEAITEKLDWELGPENE